MGNSVIDIAIIIIFVLQGFQFLLGIFDLYKIFSFFKQYNFNILHEETCCSWFFPPFYMMLHLVGIVILLISNILYITLIYEGNKLVLVYFYTLLIIGNLILSSTNFVFSNNLKELKEIQLSCIIGITQEYYQPPILLHIMFTIFTFLLSVSETIIISIK